MTRLLVSGCPRSSRLLSARLPWALLSVGVFVLAGCNKGDTITEGGVVVQTVAVAEATDNQSAQVGATLATPITVRLLDSQGQAVPNTTVAWVVLSGGGTLSVSSVDSDANGEATTVWTLGQKSGVQTITAGVFTGAVDTITAVALPGPVASFAMLDGDNQSLPVGATSQPLRVQAYDQFGNLVGGATVTWTTTAGVLSTPESVTDANGQTSVSLQVAAGDQVVTARLSNGASLNFSLKGN